MSVQKTEMTRLKGVISVLNLIIMITATISVRSAWFFHLLFANCLIITSAQGVALDDLTKADSLLKSLSNEIPLKPISSQESLKQILLLARTNHDTATMIHAQLLLANCHVSLEEYETARNLLESTDSLRIKSNILTHDYLFARVHSNILLKTGAFSEVSSYLQRCYDIASLNQDTGKIIRILFDKGYVAGYQGDMDKSLAFIDEASELIKKRGVQNLHLMHEHMGHYYTVSGEDNKAQHEFEQALQYAIKSLDTPKIASFRVNLMANYANNGYFEEAEQQYHAINRLSDLIEYPINKKAQMNYGVALVHNSKYAEAKEVLRDCLEYFKQTKDIRRQIFTHHWLAITNRGLDRYGLAAEHSKISYELATSEGQDPLAQLTAYTLFQTFHWRGRDTEAIEWLLKSNKHRDSVFSLEKEKEMLALETKYETFRKEQEIELLKAREIANQNKRKLLLVGLILSLLSGTLLVNNQIVKRKKARIIHDKERQIQIEKENNLAQALEFKQRELVAKALQLAKNNEFLQEIENEVKNIGNSVDKSIDNTAKRIQKMLNYDQLEKEDWNQFVTEFKAAHPEFIQKLKHQYGSFTHSEMRLISLLRLNLSSKEIANILRISDQGVWKSRYRVRKKMALDSEADLQAIILGL